MAAQAASLWLMLLHISSGLRFKGLGKVIGVCGAKGLESGILGLSDEGLKCRVPG